MDVILVIYDDGTIMEFSHNDEESARKFAKEVDGTLYWRDDWQNARKVVSQTFGTVESNASVVGVKIGRLG